MRHVGWIVETATGRQGCALMGSSARKLKRGPADLLAGHTVVRTPFPLTNRETDVSIPAAQRLRYGSMPMSVTAGDDEARAECMPEKSRADTAASLGPIGLTVS